jgi:hypothetical protein
MRQISSLRELGRSARSIGFLRAINQQTRLMKQNKEVLCS